MKPTNKKDDSQSQWAKSLGLFAVIVADVAGYSLAGAGIGYLLWKKLGAPWWVLVVFALAGLSLSMFRLYQLSQKM